MDAAVTQILQEVQARSLFHKQPGDVIAARVDLIAGRPFLTMAYAFTKPVIANGYVVAAPLDGGDYRNVTPYLVSPNLAEPVARATRLAADGYCVKCHSLRQPVETPLGNLEYKLTCPDCGHTELVP